MKKLERMRQMGVIYTLGFAELYATSRKLEIQFIGRVVDPLHLHR